MNKCLLLFFFCFSVAGLTSCLTDEPCNADLAAPVLVFSVVDSASGVSLIGSNRLYHPDSIADLNKDDYGYISRSHIDTLLEINYGLAVSEKPMPFWLSRSDMDTITLLYYLENTECGQFKRITHFMYNSRVFGVKGRTVHAIK